MIIRLPEKLDRRGSLWLVSNIFRLGHAIVECSRISTTTLAEFDRVETAHVRCGACWNANTTTSLSRSNVSLCSCLGLISRITPSAMATRIRPSCSLGSQCACWRISGWKGGHFSSALLLWLLDESTLVSTSGQIVLLSKMRVHCKTPST